MKLVNEELKMLMHKEQAVHHRASSTAPKSLFIANSPFFQWKIAYFKSIKH